jgi:hypothetical protein
LPIGSIDSLPTQCRLTANHTPSSSCANTHCPECDMRTTAPHRRTGSHGQDCNNMNHAAEQHRLLGVRRQQVASVHTHTHEQPALLAHAASKQHYVAAPPLIAGVGTPLAAVGRCWQPALHTTVCGAGFWDARGAPQRRSAPAPRHATVAPHHSQALRRAATPREITKYYRYTAREYHVQYSQIPVPTLTM